MKEIRLKGLDEKIYYDVCDNGLKIYIWVNEKINTFKGSLVFLGGAENTTFKIEGQEKKVPSGTAHYLEHILCKNADGSSLLGHFNALNSYSNAATYPNRTAYEFVGTKDVLKNLDVLLDAVQEKEFNEEYFEKERGPILEEERMRRDDANRVSYYKINACLFAKYPNRVSGLGTEEDIKKITLDDLKLFYQTFYHPKNSFLVVTGKVNPEEVMAFVKEKEKKKVFLPFVKPVLPKYHEPKEIVSSYDEARVNVEVPNVYISVKVPLKDLPKKNIVTLISIMQVVLASNFGDTSIFKEELLQKKLAVSVGYNVEWERQYLILSAISKTKEPDKVIPLLKEKMKHLDLEEKDIFRKIKSTIANLVLSYEDPEYVNDVLNYMLVTYGKIITNEKELLEKMTMEDILEVMKSVNFEQMNTFVLYPLKKEE